MSDKPKQPEEKHEQLNVQQVEQTQKPALNLTPCGESNLKEGEQFFDFVKRCIYVKTKSWPLCKMTPEGYQNLQNQHKHHVDGFALIGKNCDMLFNMLKKPALDDEDIQKLEGA